MHPKSRFNSVNRLGRWRTVAKILHFRRRPAPGVTGDKKKMLIFYFSPTLLKIKPAYF
jgi:hypothetical protein